MHGARGIKTAWAKASWPLLAAAAVVAAGCAKPVKLVPASGVVKIDGKPAANISVQFLPTDIKGERRPTSFALTDDDGRFQLKTYDGREGAVPGQHMVLLVDALEERPPQGQVAKSKPRLDSRKATVAGGVPITVPESAEEIVIDVKGD